MASTRRPRRQQAPWTMILLGIWLWVTPTLGAENPPTAGDGDQDSLATREAILAQERAALAESRAELEQIADQLETELDNLNVADVDAAAVDQARVDLESQRLAQDNLSAEITSAQRRIRQQEEALTELRAREQLLSNPARAGDSDTTAELQTTREAAQQAESQLALERETLANLREEEALLAQRLALAQRRLERLQTLYRQQQESHREDAQQSEEARLRGEAGEYLQQAAELRQRLTQDSPNLDPGQRQRLESELLATEELANLTELAIRLGAIDTTLGNLQSLVEAPTASPEELSEALAQRRNVAEELDTAATLLARKREVLADQLALLEQREIRTQEDRELREQGIALLRQVLDTLDTRSQTVTAQQGQADQLKTGLEQSFDTQRLRYLSAWTPLPLDLDAWHQHLAALAKAPEALIYQVQLSLASAARSVLEASPQRWWLSGAILLSLALAVVWLRRGVIPTLSRWRSAEAPFVQQLGHVILGLMEHNLLGIAIAAAAVIVVFAVEAPPPGRNIILTLILLWTGIKLPVNLAWLTLAAPHVPQERRRPALYRHWRNILVLGGVLSAITILAHLSRLPTESIALFDRLFMLYLLLAVRPVLHLRGLLLQVLSHHYSHHTWLTTLRVISLFLPLALLVTAATGLIGFLNLAWTASWYVLVFAAMLALWLILQGLINDTARWLLTHSQTSQVEDFRAVRDTVRPLQQFFSLLLFSGLLVGLAGIYGLDPEATFANAWLTLTLVVLGVVVCYEALLFLASYGARKADSAWGVAVIRHARKPAGLIMLTATGQLLVPRLDLPSGVIDTISHFLAMVQIGAISWLVVKLVSVLDDVMTLRYREVHKTSLGARRTHTQIRVLRQIVRIAVCILAVGAMLMTFPTIRQLGTGLLASAGAAGLIIGIAARPLFENLIAGIQIGLTQPIRLDDVVIVQGEWGRIAEINATYVVVHIWDDRRLVVPLKFFNEQPFENWTRTSGELLGTVHLTVDYTFPVDEARLEVKRILEESGMWDGRAWGVQVTDASAQGMELRVLLSAPDAGTAWDLRCLIREKLIAFIHQRYPGSLPRVRAQIGEDQQSRTSAPIVSEETLSRP